MYDWPEAIRFAAAHRVSGLVLYGTSVRPPTSEARAELDLVLRDWGSGRSLDTFATSLAADPARRITASLERAAASPAMIRHVIGASGARIHSGHRGAEPGRTHPRCAAGNPAGHRPSAMGRGRGRDHRASRRIPRATVRPATARRARCTPSDPPADGLGVADRRGGPGGCARRRRVQQPRDRARTVPVPGHDRDSPQAGIRQTGDRRTAPIAPALPTCLPAGTL